MSVPQFDAYVELAKVQVSNMQVLFGIHICMGFVHWCTVCLKTRIKCLEKYSMACASSTMSNTAPHARSPWAWQYHRTKFSIQPLTWHAMQGCKTHRTCTHARSLVGLKYKSTIYPALAWWVWPSNQAPKTLKHENTQLYTFSSSFSSRPHGNWVQLEIITKETHGSFPKELPQQVFLPCLWLVQRVSYFPESIPQPLQWIPGQQGSMWYK